jgi:hypothetical protein
MFRSASEAPKSIVTPTATPTAPAAPTAPATSGPYRAGQAVGQAVRGGTSGAGNLLSRGLIGTIGGPATGGIFAALTPSPLGDDQAVLAALRGEGYRDQPYDVLNARKILEAAGMDPNKAPVQPATPAATPYDPKTATLRSQYTNEPYPTTGNTRSGDAATGTGGAGIGSFKPPVLPTLTLPTAAPLTDYQDVLKGAPKIAQDASEKAVKEAEEKYTNFDKPGEEAREKRFSTREAAQEKDSAISRALNLMSVGFGVAGSKERSVAGALGKEGREGIQNLIQGEAANRAAKNRLEDLRDNFEQQKTAAKKGNYQASQAAGQRAADDARAYTQLNMQATHFGNTEANQRLQTTQQGTLGAAQLNQQGILGLAELGLKGQQLAQTGALGRDQIALGREKLDIIKGQIAAGDKRAKAALANVERQAYAAFQTSQQFRQAQERAKKMPPIEAERFMQQEWTKYSANATPSLLAAEGGGANVSSFTDLMKAME